MHGLKCAGEQKKQAHHSFVAEAVHSLLASKLAGRARAARCGDRIRHQHDVPREGAPRFRRLLFVDYSRAAVLNSRHARIRVRVQLIGHL